MTNTIFTTSDGQNLACVAWDNVKNPVGIVQIIHGMDEHIRRYDRFARFLNKNGYVVFGDDHRAHGKTATNTNNIGKVDNNPDIFMSVVSDETQIMQKLQEKYKLPLFLFGHSYGSFITERIIQQSDLCAAGVCLSGSAKYPMPVMWMLRTISWVGVKISGANAPAKIIEKFLPIRGIYPDGTSRLTRDKNQVALHNADPLRAKYFSYGFYYSLFKNLMRLSYNADNEMPMLIISGGADAVSLNASMAKALYKTYQAHNMQNLTVIIYPGARHELLMELNYKEVQNDILEFLNSVKSRCKFKKSTTVMP